jgi:hypothetical protein
MAVFWKCGRRVFATCQNSNAFPRSHYVSGRVATFGQLFANRRPLARDATDACSGIREAETSVSRMSLNRAGNGEKVGKNRKKGGDSCITDGEKSRFLLDIGLRS